MPGGKAKIERMKRDHDLAALKRGVDLLALVRSRGVELRPQGADYVGLCPFHPEESPSFHVTPGKNLFHCFGCGKGGSVIDFLMLKDGLTRAGAIGGLVEQSGGVLQLGKSLAGAKEPPPARPVQAGELLQRVVRYYARTLREDPAGMDYLKSRNLAEAGLIERFQMGYANGTLHNLLPRAGEAVEGLKTLGVLNQHGQEHFRGCVTVPLLDLDGSVTGIYGRRAGKEEPRHLYLPGPRRGLVHGVAAKSCSSLFVAESILDALSLWRAGRQNVVALYGVRGWTEDHERFFRRMGVEEVYLCLDNDESGREGTRQLKEKILPGLVKSIHVIHWPEGIKDANDFFLSRSAEDFAALVEAAHPAPASSGATASGKEQVEMTPHGFAAVFGARRYELMAIEKPSAGRLKATVRVYTPDHKRFHVDTVDFYLSRSRKNLVLEVARLLGESAEAIETEVNQLILLLESCVEKQMTEPKNTLPPLLEKERLEAQRLGRHPDLAGEIRRDMEKLGVVGEAANGLVGYLVMTSRKMEEPLALLTVSSSAAGKSYLQDTILSLCPEEELVKLTSLSDRALFYKTEGSLRHRVLALEEEAGGMGAAYAIRNLISSKKLVIETTVKNPLTGKLETQLNTVHGPTAVFQTTTNPDTDAETRSRFLILSVDESGRQTRAILESQRQSHTLEGLRQKRRREEILARHHAFQQLLQPVKVVNPFEPLLGYPDDRLLVRREHPKYLNLILAVTFLYQMQRPVKYDPELGPYIETTLDDIAIVNQLMEQLLGHCLEELSPPSRQLLGLLFEYVGSRARQERTDPARVLFSRRELREALKWGDTRLRTHVEELVKLEYLLPVSGSFGKAYQYRLLYDPEAGDTSGRFLAGLKPVEQLRQEASLAGILGHLAGEKPRLAPTPQLGKREVQNPTNACSIPSCVPSPAHLAAAAEPHIRSFFKEKTLAGEAKINRAGLPLAAGGNS